MSNDPPSLTALAVGACITYPGPPSYVGTITAGSGTGPYTITFDGKPTIIDAQAAQFKLDPDSHGNYIPV